MTRTPRTRFAQALAAVLAALALGCASAVVSNDGESLSGDLQPNARARDEKLEDRLRRALLTGEGLGELRLGVHVYMERGFVIGRVNYEDVAQQVHAVSERVRGLLMFSFGCGII